MPYTKEQIAAALDLAVLKPIATLEDVERACALANKHRIKSVCVAPVYVRWAVDLFDNVSSVIGFPHGNSTPDAKYYEAIAAMRDGAKELDVVVNYGRFLDGDQVPLLTELTMICDAAHRDGVLVKAILETVHYAPMQLTEAAELAIARGVDFLKTSTGFAPDGNATVGVVSLLKQVAAGRVQIKASGGINSYERAAEFLDLGCTRLGSSKFHELLP